ncbi:hypothetical protein ACDZ28_07760 [Paenibacillus sp. RS8]|uniref:hypothetical protein n=1 Tax=Paenibacillus sp. RS8 TaxID=3242681 RepID=UPI0035C013C7
MHKMNVSGITTFELTKEVVNECINLDKLSKELPIFEKKERTLLRYKDHFVESYVEEVSQFPPTRFAETSMIQVEGIDTEPDGIFGLYRVKFKIPELIVGDLAKFNRVRVAADSAIKATAKHWYVKDELTELESLLLVMELEVNRAISKALYRTNERFIRSNINIGTWYSVRFLTENNEPLLTVWRVKNCIPAF